MPAPVPLPPLTLPIEVLGDGSPLTPVVAEGGLAVASASLSSVAHIYVKCHRCGFFGAPEHEATSAPPVRVKASLRVLGGATGSQADAVPWTDITDTNVTLADAERVHGGIDHGGLYTVSMKFVLDAATRARLVAAPQLNRVQFRFNGTDGESNGLRILDLQLQDSAGANLAINPVQHADIQAEKTAGRTLSPDVAAGLALWNSSGRLMKSSIVRRPLQAACSSCHASDGRDLQYFNYSNNAIVQRARFHGLSDAQGRQIVAFLRYSLRDLPHVAQAAPWNPPYQPGPGLDARPVTEWAAGAGLDAVIDDPRKALKALFGKPLDAAPPQTTQADLDGLMAPGSTLNVRETAIGLQLPDWNAWLPATHPLDVWPAAPTGSFASGAKFAGSDSIINPAALQADIEAWLDAHRNPNGVLGDWSHLTAAQREQIQQKFFQFGWEGYHFIGGGRGDHVAPQGGQYGAQVGAANLKARASAVTTAADPGSFTTSAFIERAVSSMMQWNAVRQWEWAQRYGLEGGQQAFIGENAGGKWKGRGEARGWPFNTVSVFNLAPHMLYQQDVDGTGKVTREWVMAWEANHRIGSYYRTNGWYQLQMTINPGGQGRFSNYPMDWTYQWGFTHVLTKALRQDGSPAALQQALSHMVRRVQVQAKMGQFVNNDLPLNAPDPSRPTDIWFNKGILGRAIALKHLQPSQDFLLDYSADPIDRSYFRDLDMLEPGLYLQTLNATIAQFNGLYASTSPRDWRTCDPAYPTPGFQGEPYAPYRFCLDATRHDVPADGQGRPRMIGGGATSNTTDQMMQYAAGEAAKAGAEARRLEVFRAWIDKAWPK